MTEEERDWTERDAEFYESKGNKPPMIARDASYYTGEKALRDDAEQAKSAYREDNVGKQEDTRHLSSQRFHQILRSLGDLHDKKQRDYGTSSDPFANVRASEAFGIPGWLGAVIRGNDKMRRLMTAGTQVTSGKEVSMSNESIEDSLLDLAVYSIIAFVLLEEEKE